MAMQYHIETPEGTHVVDTPTIMQQLQASGQYNVQGTSDDGTSLNLAQPDGSVQTVPVTQLLGNLGWQVSNAVPMDGHVDYDNVQAGWRAAVHKLPDDMTRRAYVEGRMREVGVEQPQIQGAGRNWYVFNPGSKTWIAVTNSPTMDRGDIMEAGLEIPKYAGSAFGGAAGAVAGGGVASLATAAGGAALGGAGVDVLERSAIAAADPTFRRISSQNLGAHAADIGKGAALDAATMGAFKGLPMAAKAISPKMGQVMETMANTGLASSAMEGTGAVLQGGGRAVRGLAGAIDNPLGRNLASAGMPIAGEASAAGFMMQAPEYLATAGARGIGTAGRGLEKLAGRAETAFAGARRGNLAQGAQGPVPAPTMMEQGVQAAVGGARRVGRAMQGASDALRAPTAPRGGMAEEVTGAATRLGNRMRTQPTAPGYGPQVQRETASQVMENAFGKVAQKVHRMFNQNASVKGHYTRLRAETLPRGGKIPAMGAWREAREHAAEESARAAAPYARFGRSVGSGMEQVGALGRGIEGAASSVAGAAIKGAKYGGQAAYGAGTGMRATGAALKSVENRGLARFGAEENSRSGWEESELRRRLLRQHPSYMMGGELAQN